MLEDAVERGAGVAERTADGGDVRLPARIGRPIQLELLGIGALLRPATESLVARDAPSGQGDWADLRRTLSYRRRGGWA